MSDIWTDPRQIAFMAITYHYLTQDFKLASGLLDFVPITGSHTGIRIGKVFRDSMEDFGLSKEKVYDILILTIRF
jgi:hypothetical protein